MTVLDGFLYRPCGACSALVPASTGCPHWKPGATRDMIKNRARQARRDRDLEVSREQARIRKQRQREREVRL